MVAEDEDKSKYRRVASDTPDSSCNEWKQIRDRATKIVIVRALSVLLIEIVQNCSFDPWSVTISTVHSYTQTP